MEHGERRVTGGPRSPAAQRAGTGHVGLHHVRLEPPQQAADRPPAQRVPGAVAPHPRTLEVRAPVEAVHGIAFRRTDGEDLVAARRERPAQVDEHLLPSAQAARQHDLGNTHRPSLARFRSRLRAPQR